MLWIKEVEMVGSVDDFVIIAISFKVILISRILKCWTRELHLEQDHPEFLLQ